MPDVDVSEVDALAASLEAAAVSVMPRVVPVVKRGALNIKKAMKADAGGHRFLPGLASTVNYDIDQTLTSVTATVGFRKIGQGNLANVAAFGTVKNAPVMDITRGLKAEVPVLMEWLARVGVEAVLR